LALELRQGCGEWRNMEKWGEVLVRDCVRVCVIV
jgi:hypothetical protein